MTYQQALVYANKLCKGFPFTARQKALKEYNELCKNLIEEKIKLEETLKLKVADMVIGKLQANQYIPILIKPIICKPRSLYDIIKINREVIINDFLHYKIRNH